MRRFFLRLETQGSGLKVLRLISVQVSGILELTLKATRIANTFFVALSVSSGCLPKGYSLPSGTRLMPLFLIAYWYLDLGEELFLERGLGHHADQGFHHFAVLEEQHGGNGANAEFG